MAIQVKAPSLQKIEYQSKNFGHSKIFKSRLHVTEPGILVLGANLVTYIQGDAIKQGITVKALEMIK